ncbi:hypothetical protein K469DRAFT_686390 [Zopfia rhizophila CBS 207.26]|uniref:Aminoglycoside phosphotransferase domain-containing protein n=1 Tax=Zopfia rhizophila CBS 207.26 TaxID=1314779 RepID=A0A6A6E9K9_9PEZI|nr:hypothetical protein K469DRAFT_686390 [Zopfia rhizophila CBS 207.26]
MAAAHKVAIQLHIHHSNHHGMHSDTPGEENEVAEEVQKKLKSLNQSMIDKANDIVNNNEPTADLWPQFRKANADYKKRRSEIVGLQNPKPEPSGPVPEPERDDDLKHTIPEEDIYILWPLAPALQKSLQIPAATKGVVIQNAQASISRLILKSMLIQGEVLYQYSARAVIRISTDTVVKINKSKDTTELHNLHHIRKNSQQIPVPQALGMISIGKWSYSFTSFLPGVSLNRIWGNLTSNKKSHVRDQLNHAFTKLRGLPIPSKEGCLGGGTSVVCKASHRFTKTSSSPIINEAQFNDFLLDDSWLDPARVDYLRASLPSGHRIVLTHGDLCPLNILVESEDAPNITGIVDWETGGGYPEYWEYVNAFRSSFEGQDDWYRFLPEEGIGRFFDEYARYRVIGRSVRG